MIAVKSNIAAINVECVCHCNSEDINYKLKILAEEKSVLSLCDSTDSTFSSCCS